MSQWSDDFGALVRNQMRYAFSCEEYGVSVQLMESEFREALGYLLEFVEMQRKACFMEGYARGMAEAISSKLGDMDVECSRHHSERSWEEFSK